MIEQLDIKSDRLNDDVALFAGCTLAETMSVLFVSSIIGILFGLLPVYFIFGHFTLGSAASLVVMSIAFFPLLMKLSRLKRGKPSGYHQQYLRIQLSKAGLIRNPYLMRSGKWSTERTV